MWEGHKFELNSESEINLIKDHVKLIDAFYILFFYFLSFTFIESWVTICIWAAYCMPTTKPSFLDWHRNLRIVLMHDNWLCPWVALSRDTRWWLDKGRGGCYNKHSDDDSTTTCVMFATILPELQKQHKSIDANTWVTKVLNDK